MDSEINKMRQQKITTVMLEAGQRKNQRSRQQSLRQLVEQGVGLLRSSASKPSVLRFSFA
jgi:hypothetical protein